MKANHHTLSFLMALLVLLAPLSVASASGKSSKKSLENSKSVKYKSKTEVNFDEATIEGSVRTPYGQSLNSRDQNFNRNFIKYRKHFHDQMLLSTGGLSP